MTFISDVMHQLSVAHPATYHTLKRYLSPSYETSLFKGIPVTEENLEHIKALKAHIPVRVRFRGPRPEVSANGTARHKFNRQSYCLKCDATSVAIYSR